MNPYRDNKMRMHFLHDTGLAFCETVTVDATDRRVRGGSCLGCDPDCLAPIPGRRWYRLESDGAWRTCNQTATEGS